MPVHIDIKEDEEWIASLEHLSEVGIESNAFSGLAWHQSISNQISDLFYSFLPRRHLVLPFAL